MLSRKNNKILSDIPSSKKQEAEGLISSLRQSLETLEEDSKSQNKESYIKLHYSLINTESFP